MELSTADFIKPYRVNDLRAVAITPYFYQLLRLLSKNKGFNFF